MPTRDEIAARKPVGETKTVLEQKREYVEWTADSHARGVETTRRVEAARAANPTMDRFRVEGTGFGETLKVFGREKDSPRWKQAN
jgi:hypothetical protein